MPTSNDRTGPNNEDQRQELESAERAASAGQPKSFRDEAMKDKVVEVDPIGKDDSAIKGLDPK